MKVSSFRNSSPSRRVLGFTLIELLVVITIIAILVGVIFAAGPAVMRNAKKASTRTDMKSLQVAIGEYYTEYNRYPVPRETTEDLFFGDGGESTEELMNVLLAEPAGWNADHLLNPKEIVFFEPRLAKGAAKRSGLADDGKYYDVFGNEYRILVDSDYNEIIDHAEVEKFDYTNPGTNEGAAVDGKFEYLGGVVIQSLGQDGEHGKNGNAIYKGSDDTASWLR
ncbi:MAG: prepilin-type N-terminal cleavage/methylation domain-containing protein [Verrucomicrobiota bacterium]